MTRPCDCKKQLGVLECECCIACSDEACDGKECMEPDPGDDDIRDMWMDEYREWAENLKTPEAP